MLSFLRFFIGCWHDWSKWEMGSYISSSIFFKEPAEVTMQERHCKKCNLTQTKTIYG